MGARRWKGPGYEPLFSRKGDRPYPVKEGEAPLPPRIYDPTPGEPSYIRPDALPPPPPEPSIAEWPYTWRVHTRPKQGPVVGPARAGQPCRVLVRGRKNTCIVEFVDGFRLATSRNYLRRRKARA